MPATLEILISKNIAIEKRGLKKFLKEVVIILVCFLTISLNPIEKYTDYELDSSDAQKTKLYNAVSLNDLSIPKKLLKGVDFSVLYTPNSDYYKPIMEGVKTSLGLTKVIPYATEDEMMDKYDPKKTFAAVVLPAAKDELKHLSITLRFPYKFRSHKDAVLHSNLWATRCAGTLTPNEDDEENDIQTDLYVREGFLQLQHAIFVQWANKQLNTQINAQATVKAYRHHTNKELCRIEGSSNLTMFLYSFAFFLPFLHLLWQYGREREENILAHHWRYGYSYFSYWLGHYIVSFLHLLVLDVVVVIALKIPIRNDEYSGSFDETNPIFILLLLVIYNIALMISVVVIVSMSSKARDAVLFGSLIWLSMFSLFSIVIESSSTVRSPVMILSFLLFFNNGFPWGMRYLKNIDTATDSSEIWILMAVVAGSGLVSMTMLSFVNFFFPGRYIECLPFDFFCLSFGKSKDDDQAPKKVVISDQTPSLDNFEYGPLKGVQFVKLKNVGTMRGRTNKYLLKTMNLRVFSGEITVLLGPHSSGKTTVISLMAGWKNPDVGSVHIEERDLSLNWEEMRHHVDVSMPNNPLFDMLTVEETLIYYINIKQRSNDDQKLRMELDKWFEALKPSKLSRHALIKYLSFEHKRLVSLCCTMAGGTSVILLDEPTLHMRSPEQHLYWNILQKEKPDRAIFITTFDAQKAELIGDRIGIINEGILLAYGTPFFLKSKLGVGCDLIISKNSNASSEAITELIRRFIPDIFPDNEIGNEIFYKVSVESRHIYQNLLINLDKEKERLGIVNVRMLGSEMNEIYMTLDKRKNNQVIVSDKKYNISYVTRSKLSRQQTYALLYKKLLHQAPNLIPLITFGICFLCMALIANMAQVLRGARHNNQIFLGIHTSETSRSKFIPDVGECKFLEISQTVKGESTASGKVNAHSRLFTTSSFKCIKKPYDEYLKESKTVYDKLGGVEIGDNYVAWSNAHMFHSAALSLNLLHNLLLSKNNAPDDVLVSVVNQPVPVPLRTKINLLDQQMMHLVLPIVLGVIIPISVGCFIIPLTEERVNNVLHLQIMTGISMTTYWLVNLLWDFATYFSYTILYVIVMALCSLEGFSFYAKLLTMLLINAYGIAGIAMIYLISLFFCYSRWSSFLIAVLVQIVTGIVSYIFYWDIIDNNLIFFYIWSAFPAFSMLDGISNIYTETAQQAFCEERCKRTPGCTPDNICKTVPQCCAETFFKFEDPGILLSIVCMLCSAAVCMTLVICIEKRRWKRKFVSKVDVKSCHSACFAYDDRDVVALRKKIAEQDLRDSLRKQFMVDQLEHSITRYSTELRTISFILDKGTCLGIYGSRNSGKSHLIRQLVGEDSFSFGDVYLEGHELKRELKVAHVYMSYAPQEGGLWNSFTPRELLRFFCMLRGIVMDDIPEVLYDLSSSFDMRSYMDRRIGMLSVGRRRKVSIAVAMIAHHRVIVLDEPTRGLPPHMCREIWNVIRFKRFNGKAIVFTTSDVAELEALSDRVIIFDEGEMWAVGSSQYLRQKYTRGFYLEVKLKRDGSTAEEAVDNLRKDSENLQRFITFLHEESELQYHIDAWFRFYLPVQDINYANLYGAMEKNRRRLNIADYSISQGTLENVMLMIYNIRKHRARISLT